MAETETSPPIARPPSEPAAPGQDPTTEAGAEAVGPAWHTLDRGMYPLVVRAAWDETPTLRGLRLSGPAELVQQYRAPGQYLELMHAEAGSAYFALAAAPAPSALPPGSAELELLVRRGPGLAGVLAGLPPEGAAGPPPLRTHGVRGAGFALLPQAGRDLVLVAAGSGIAPLRAVLQLLLQHRQRYGRVALYYGERVETDFAYRRELLALPAAAVAVELVLTQPPATWQGGVGYVQAHLRAQPPAWLGPNTAALLCGQPAMVSEATALLSEHRVPASQILLNY
jgi:NAD(P)H-flavin reductase